MTSDNKFQQAPTKIAQMTKQLKRNENAYCLTLH